MIRLFDGNNYYRRKLEANPTGKTAREVLTDTLNCSDVQVWVWDGVNANAKRRAIYPEYKANRKVVRKDIYAGFETVQRVLEHTRAFQISVPGYEGDDVIATLARRYAESGNEVSIYSTDFDFVQLTGQYKDRIFCGARLKEHIPSDLVRHYKTWVGDPSDNIRGIPGFGDITWQRTDKEVIRHITASILEAHTGSGFSIDAESSLSDKVRIWLSDQANRATFRNYWDIIGFYEVPDILIDEHLVVGVEDYHAADLYLKQWFQ